MTTQITMNYVAWQAIKRLLDEIDQFKAKFPGDYRRVGYYARLEKIADLLNQEKGNQ
jgi:hypothetical protein